MNGHSALPQAILQTFTAEAQEYIQSISRDLLALEEQASGADPALLQRIYREAHNLKGSARAIGLLPVSDIAHRLESVFGLLGRDEREIPPGLFDLAYRSLDRIHHLVTVGSPAGQEDPESAQLLLALDAIFETPEPSPESSAASGHAHTSSPQAQAPHSNGASTNGPVAAVPGPGSSAPAPIASARTDAGAEETVRLSIHLLDDLMAHTGELQISRIAIADALAELEGLAVQISAWENAWRKGRSRHRRLLGRRRNGPAAVAVAPVAEGNGPAALDQSEQRALGVVLDFLETNHQRLTEIRTGVDRLHGQLKEDSHKLAQAISTLQDDVHRTRLRPLTTLLDPFPRMVRDLARSMDKQVRLVIEGADTEVDSSMVQELKAPLMHLIRNSLDHGIESPDQRAASGKETTGTIAIRAQQQGDNILVRVSDDGGGIEVGQVVERAVARGIVAAEQAQSLGREDALWLIFRSGFSTSPEVTDISGRGVGLDVVRDHIENLHGTIQVKSEPGTGTTFTLTLPLSIATVLALLVEVAGQTFAVPSSAVSRIVRVGPDNLFWLEGSPVLRLDDTPVLISSVAGLMNLEAERSLSGIAIVLDAGGRQLAVLIDELLGAQELVFKSLPKPLLRVRHIAGVSILGNGDAVPILNAADLIHSVYRRASAWKADEQPSDRAAQAPAVLVVDDSVTIRTLERSILETAGYRVQTAADGAEAWKRIQGASFDLIVSDVQMPRMNGIELTETLRGDERFKFLPVVLVTSLESEQDRQAGIRAGADAYIVKGSFDQQQLLDAVAQFTGQVG